MKGRKLLAAGAALMVVLAACSGGGKKKAAVETAASVDLAMSFFGKPHEVAQNDVQNA